MTSGAQSPETSSSAAGGNDRTAFLARRDAIEEAYEFMLAYAAQGLRSEEGSSAGGEIRDILRRCDAALSDLGDVLTNCARSRSGDAMAPYQAFIGVIERDSRDSRAMLQLVLAQPTIGSQIVDNLNASIHLRALLTDLFLIDEVLKS